MRIESLKRGFIPFLFALALLMAFAPAPVYPQIIGPGPWTVEVIVDNVVYHHHPYPNGPSRETPKVVQGGIFIIRCKSAWTEPEYDGAYTVTLSWTNYDNHENENFTFVGASAYFTSGAYNGQSINAVTTLASSPSGSDTKYALSVSCPADNKDNRDGDFNVDITMSASGAGGVPHIPTDNATISIPLGGLLLMEPTPDMFTEVDPITIEVLPQQPGVEVDISPTSQEGVPLATLTYNVTVTNTGDIYDNYDLAASDNENWGPTLSENLLENVGPGENRVIMLSVTVPENATLFDEDHITVTATSAENASMSDSASCVARVQGEAWFRLATLYEVRLDVELYLISGSKLVAKFYTYGNAFEGENIVWSGAAYDNVSFSKNVPHPGPGRVGVKKVRLDLTTENTENVISTLDNFTIRKGDLELRFQKIPIIWALASPPDKYKYEIELSQIPLYWALAPSGGPSRPDP